MSSLVHGTLCPILPRIHLIHLLSPPLVLKSHPSPIIPPRPIPSPSVTVRHRPSPSITARHRPPPGCSYTTSTRFDKAHSKIFAGKSLQQEKKERDARTNKKFGSASGVSSRLYQSGSLSHTTRPGPAAKEAAKGTKPAIAAAAAAKPSKAAKTPKKTYTVRAPLADESCMDGPCIAVADESCMDGHSGGG